MSGASTPFTALGESQKKKKGRESRPSIKSEEPAIRFKATTSPPVPNGPVWYSPPGLADRLTGSHGGQANTEQIQAAVIELQGMHLNQGGFGPVDW